MSDWVPTHRVREQGAPARSTPDPEAAASATLEGDLEVAVKGFEGDLTKIQTSDGWIGWVESGRLDWIGPPSPDGGDGPGWIKLDPALQELLTEALVSATAAINSFEQEEIDSDTLQQLLMDRCVVEHDRRLWIIDLANQQFVEFDGLAVAAYAPAEVPEPDQR